MKANSKISAAVAAILSAPATMVVFAADQADTSTAASTSAGQITEVVVTAQRRSENIQDVPITMQALTAETLKQLNVTTFDDYMKYLPNVSQASWGPGQSLIFMRGLSSGALGTQGSGTDANFPNVAVYLDEQSAQMPYRNLDVYAVDIDRIEVLEGPQGTLFGAGAEAGAIRYITNKPKLDVTEGNVEGGYGYTATAIPTPRSMRRSTCRSSPARSQCAAWCLPTAAAATSTTCPAPSRAGRATSASPARCFPRRRTVSFPAPTPSTPRAPMSSTTTTR